MTLRRQFIVRKGKEKGKGLYARHEGCMCSACIRWVEDRDDATAFVARNWPRKIAREGGGRVVRLVRKTSQPGGTDTKGGQRA